MSWPPLFPHLPSQYPGRRCKCMIAKIRRPSNSWDTRHHKGIVALKTFGRLHQELPTLLEMRPFVESSKELPLKNRGLNLAQHFRKNLLHLGTLWPPPDEKKTSLAEVLSNLFKTTSRGMFLRAPDPDSSSLRKLRNPRIINLRAWLTKAL